MRFENSRLVAVKLLCKDKNGREMWLCRCDCGNEKVILKSSLLNGYTLSCGCYRNERIKETAEKHFATINGETKSLSEWAEVLNINYYTLAQRVHRGMTPEEAILKPIRKRKAVN